MLNTNYGCHYYAFINKVFTRNGNGACWAGIQVYVVPNQPKYIYITDYDNEHTRKYQKLLISLINEITPCTFLTRQKVKYIKYELMSGGYNKNLVLLNFIRNLWSNPRYSENIDYTKIFFETLEKSNKKDPLEMLMEANIKACEGLKYAPGHSNVNPVKDMKIKNKKQLLESKDLPSTVSFFNS